MGVKGLNRNINENLSPINDKWILDRNIYNNLISNHQKEINSQSGNLVLIIDASAYYYKICDKINWFVFDITNFLKLLKEDFHYLLSIKNLKKIIFVFDGVNSPFKAKTELERRKNRISSNNEFFNSMISYASPDQKNTPKTLSPSPLVHMTYIQFLVDISKVYEKIETKFFTLEADAYIAKLANEYNGYVISKDSDFFIYKTPGYINIDSIEFPNGTYDNNFVIKYKLYTRSMILNYLHLTDDSLPIFAALCGNDYLKMDNYPEMKNFIKYYNRYHSSRQYTNSISYFIYKNIINFVLDMDNFNYNSYYNEYILSEGITSRQKSIIENVCAHVPLGISTKKEFKNNLIESVRQYNIPSTTTNNDDISIYININDSLLKSKVNEISSDILRSFYSGNFYFRLLNVLIKDQFLCYYYIEDLSKESCWNITSNMRKTMYELIKSRNYKNKEKINPETIEEISRIGINVNTTNVSINPHYQNIFDCPIEKTFNNYLIVFKSNTSKVKALPYYLIPVVASLRHLLKDKMKNGLFVDKNNNQKRISSSSSSLTKLYDYELKALLASSIAALTFTYLNESSPYLDDTNYTLNLLSSLSLNSSSSSSSSHNLNIRDNIEKNDQMTNQYNNYSNIYRHMKLGEGRRSLQLKNYQSIKRLQRNSSHFKNAIHIYAEFTNTLIMNSYMLQVFKLTERLPSFWSFFSMYTYLWEGSYYSMIESFRDNDNLKISSIFDSLYDVKNTKNSKNYLLELEKIYSKMLDAIMD